ncbi:Cutinase transcription factor 1 alpha [Colletotrichum orbiculare MAFF 240422]|uniref:Cutinase transcription factor 1 alpha n=1 Tax=Colletotrichum orbiculare (strain 104-T / ATCC 96160 / CBS 514.97 / LARS 414 / MAFF 240422) TaxID=1213857 RepID=A0A484FQS3_COLOR|nr:Cutinase transcription factor 1 alpha [Colletotrichum orbiculare MAFF 240422]
MSNDPSSVRRILPQSSQMGSFSFAPQQYPQRETQKNYVFVDEHNRHKRLKVMRACEGCRRRKIKCDAATTNTWPCSACIRLKLHCVRPNGQYDGTSADNAYEPGRDDFAAASSQLQDSFRQQAPMQQSMMGAGQKPASMYAQSAYSDQGVFPPVSYSDQSSSQHNIHYTTVSPSVGMMEQSYANQNVFPTPPLQQSSRADSPPDTYSQDGSYQQADLADLLGSLKVNEAGTAPYLRNKASFRHEEEPAVEDADDYKDVLPPLPSGPGLKIRIPPELMPDDDTAMHYFDLFFIHVHPYVPVISKPMFYHQWNTNRHGMSPLILEAMFAIGGRLADDPAQGQQWLALASKHADSFMDVPRLSTLQALLLILKAREAAPKRGYYYRSWMTIVQCVQMGKDLGLDEHYSDHQAGRPCGSSPTECQMKSRIWQSIFVCETMIGSPQGRTDLAVELDSIDFSVPRPIPGGDDSEYSITRNFTYFARIVRNVSRMNTAYGRLKKKKTRDWGVDPEFVQLNPALNAWLNDLPADLSVTFPPDGSPPWVANPYIGNLHSYYYLTLILLHRPQLNFLDPNGVDGQWKQHMMICYSSAKALCRLQEAVLDNFGFSGLQSMLRGFSFTVYCGLCCIVLHLVAVVSPDPDLNTDARQYFTRHMRVLEKVMSVWPMADLQKQVDAVREAFSADTRKPFVLKPSFPYGSPQSSSHSSPPRGYRPGMARAGSLDHQLETNLQHSQSLVMMANQGSQAPGMPQTMPLADAPTWNPSRIFEQWNTSFGAPEAPSLQDIQAVHATLPVVSQQMSQQYSAAPAQTFISPAMWQESVASVYEGGLKRGWDYDGGGPVMKRR